ncbi:MAG: ABC transporter ATP-binding protein [SAR324 cluster bacterium]|nr:ABC transporter ATP-binding protein [SAR324 cluster bacterium]
MLEIRNLTKHYGKTLAVNQVSLQVRPGEIMVLLGPNGSGKSSLMKIISGLLKSDSGRIEWNSEPLTPHWIKQNGKIGYCPQFLQIWEDLTPLEQLVFMGLMYGGENEQVKTQSVKILEQLGLTPQTHQLTRILSGGMKQRVNIGLALIHEPALILLDEPTNGLDPHSLILIRELLRTRSRQQRQTMMIATHDMDEADKLADRIAILHLGKIIACDEPHALKQRVDPSGNISMEDVFIALTGKVS